MKKIKKYMSYAFVEKPIIGWGFLALLVWLSSSFLWGLLVFFIGLGILAHRLSVEGAKQIPVAKDVLKDEAKKLVEEIKTNKRLVKIQPSVFLDADESAFLEESSALFEAKSVRESTGMGIGFRIMRGVSVGGYQSRSESHQELGVLDYGRLIVTNKKLIFRGGKENRAIPLSKIIGLKMYSDSIEIASSGRQKGSTFSVKNPYIWNVIVYVLRSVENPLDFSSIQKIDIAIE